MNIIDAKKLIKHLFALQIETGVRYCVELESGPGVGKSQMSKQIAEELAIEWGEPVKHSAEFLSTREQPDMAGYALPSTDPVDGSAIMVRTFAPWMPRAGDPTYGIINLDEFRQAPPEVQKPAAELMLNGRVGESQLPITYFVMASSNRESDRSGVYRSLAFIENRRMLIRIEPSLDAWTLWAEKSGINMYAVAFAKAHPSIVFQDKVPDKSGPFCTPRTLVQMSYLIGKLPDNLMAEAAMGYMGEGAGAQFIAFLRVVDELPTYEEVVKDPMGTKVPDKPDACYACVQMLSYKVQPKHIVPVFKFIQRMRKEFQISGLQACVRQQPTIVNTPDFANWVKSPEVVELLTAAHRLDTQFAK